MLKLICHFSVSINKPIFSDLDDDTLIHIFGFLDVKDILRLRRTSTRLGVISRQRVVWTRALTLHVLNQGLPFPPVRIDALTTPSLEEFIIRSIKLADFWTHSTSSTTALAKFSASSGTGVSEVRFLPTHPGWVVTVTRGIWPLITCWDVSECADTGHGARKVAEWFRKGALFTGIAVNSDPDAEACLAVSLSFAGDHCVEILSIRSGAEHGGQEFVSLASIKTTLRAMTLKGDVIALSDDVNETHILNWRTNELSVLWGSDEPSEYNFQHNRCLQVLFSQKCIFVVRARSFEAFLNPPLQPPQSVTRPQGPLACHRFGWIDGVAVTEQKQLPSTTQDTATWPPIHILLRAESDDPWSSDVHTLDLYTIHPDLSYVDDVPSSQDTSTSTAEATPEPTLTHPPYIFPPHHTASFPSARGHLRCTDIHPGPHGTAVWIQPRPARNLGLTALDVHASDAQGTGVHPLSGARIVGRESLVAALLPGVLKDRREGTGDDRGDDVGEEGDDDVWALASLGGSGGSWTSVDYDEARGLVALGESTGGVTVLRLE